MDVWTELRLHGIITDAMEEERLGSVAMEILTRNHSVLDELLIAELMMVASWYIWWQGIQHYRAVVSIKVPAMNYTRAHTSKQPMRTQDHMWKKPGSDVIEINVDVAFHMKHFRVLQVRLLVTEKAPL